jgi:hypothetical protein
MPANVESNCVGRRIGGCYIIRDKYLEGSSLLQKLDFCFRVALGDFFKIVSSGVSG